MKKFFKKSTKEKGFLKAIVRELLCDIEKEKIEDELEEERIKQKIKHEKEFWERIKYCEEIKVKFDYVKKIEEAFKSENTFKADVWEYIVNWKKDDLDKKLYFDLDDRPALWSHSILEMEVRLTFEKVWDDMIRKGYFNLNKDGSFSLNKKDNK